MNKNNQFFWEDKYKENETGWDLGIISPPIKNYIDQIINKDISILIPGSGNSYEAEYLINNGFNNITVLDIAHQPLLNLQKRVPKLSKNKLIQGDFFHFIGEFDLIIEQTFFCALEPILRSNYARQVHDLLKPKGKLIGLLFDFPLTKEGPPFGGNIYEYKNIFSNYFHIKTLNPCYNSIKSRKERELFINFEKIKFQPDESIHYSK